MECTPPTGLHQPSLHDEGQNWPGDLWTLYEHVNYIVGDMFKN